MLHVTVDVDIDRPVAEVWKYVAEQYFANHGSWDSAIIGMEQCKAGPLGVDTLGRKFRKIGPVRQAVEFRVTAFAAPHLFALRNISGPFALERAYTFAARDDRTALSFTFDMRAKGAMRLVFALLSRRIARDVRANIRRIPAAVTSAPVNAS